MNREGKEVLCQIILWNWERRNGVDGYHVIAWKLESVCTAPDKINGRWVGRFDKRTVSALMYMETYSTFDPELEQRSRLPECERSGLK